MMNPQMMQQAQSMMANMTPEQMASMQQMVQNMSPEQRANMERMAQQQMGGGMGGAPPGAPAAGTSQSPQAQYQLGGARMLKDEGNTLHKAGRHSEALAKYEKAISNVSGGANLKAFYRRGQANMGLAEWPAAVKDLKMALNMCARGDAQRDLISEKLTEALRSCPEGADVSIDTPAAPHTTARSTQPPKSYNDGSIVIEEVTDEPEIQPASSTRSAGAAPMMPGMGPGGMDYVSQMMKNNPDYAKNMIEQMSALPPEEIEKMAGMAGMTGFDATTAKQMAEMMKGMPPEKMQEMAQMAERMHSSSATGAGGSGAGGAGGQPPAVDPGMAADMLQSMSPDQIAGMAEAAQNSGMMPEGFALDADMIKTGVQMSAEMMKNMSKEDLAKMQGMAGSAHSVGGMPGNMADMLSNPDAMKTAMNMMKSMDKDGLKNMLKMQQPGMTDEAAEKAAEAMKNMDERVMGIMMTGMAGFQKAKGAMNAAKKWVLARPAVMIALVVLMVAVILRVAGIM